MSEEAITSGTRESTPPAATTSPWDASYYVRTNGINYGPYTGHQIKAFIAEGRVVGATLIAAEGDASWRRADQDALFGPLIGQVAVPQPKPAVLAVRAKLMEAEERASHKFGQRSDGSDPKVVSNFIIIFDVKSRGSAKLEQFIMELGPATRLAPTVWLVSGSHAIGALRNQLVQYFGSTDSFTIIDATHNKIGWFNHGPEVDSRIHRVWKS